jgi:hypothetical protein
MAQSTSPDLFGGVENRRADLPATTVYCINAKPAPVGICLFSHWFPLQ